MMIDRYIISIICLKNSFIESFVGLKRSTSVDRGIRMSFTANNQLRDSFVLFNTESRKKEIFIPQSPPKVSFYSCGPTVYDYAHIGNFRAFLTYDILKRWLEYCGYDVTHVCNLTDVDDKIIIKINEEKKTLQDITSKYSKAFFEDLEVLNVRKANHYPRATSYIKDMEKIIDRLLTSNHAYTQRGSVYYRVSAFKSYGEFAGLKSDDIVDGAGVVGPNDRRGADDKESPQDFALWKAYNPQDGEVYWDTKHGRGRPGWHIECSAMCCNILGETIDIHAGGIDLVFPHHQNEIAQTEAYTGKKFSRYWVHNGFVNINNVKMSKSLKNFKTLRDIATSPFDARAFRYLVVTSQYRNSLNFSPETLKAAINSLKRIDRAVLTLREASSTNSTEPLTNAELEILSNVDQSWKSFEEAMCDDLNSPKATAQLFNIISIIEKASKGQALTPHLARRILSVIEEIDSVFGILYEVPVSYFGQSTTKASVNDSNNLPGILVDISSLPSNIAELANRRAELKNSKQYDQADQIRVELLNIGYIIRDKKGGGYEVYQR